MKILITGGADYIGSHPLVEVLKAGHGALDRTQPGLPLKKGRAATMTHDYKRHGTTVPSRTVALTSAVADGAW